MALEAQNNPFTSILMVEAADPEALPDADPAAGQRRLVVGTDHLLYLVSDLGVKTAVGGASGAMATDALWDAAGDLAQGTGANTGAKLSAGTAGYVLTSNGAGAAVSWQAPSAATFSGCSVSGTSTALTSNVENSLAFNSADTYDTDSYHDPASNNTRLIPPTTAKYRLSAVCAFPASDTERKLGYRVAGGTLVLMARAYILDVGAGWYLNFSVDLALTATTDYVEVRAMSSAGGTVTVYRAQLTRIG